MSCLDYNQSILKLTGHKFERRKGMEPMKYTVTVDELLNDLETMTDGIFDAETTRGENELVLVFSNGQTFRIRVEDIPE